MDIKQLQSSRAGEIIWAREGSVIRLTMSKQPKLQENLTDVNPIQITLRLILSYEGTWSLNAGGGFS